MRAPPPRCRPRPDPSTPPGSPACCHRAVPPATRHAARGAAQHRQPLAIQRIAVPMTVTSPRCHRLPPALPGQGGGRPREGSRWQPGQPRPHPAGTRLPADPPRSPPRCWRRSARSRAHPASTAARPPPRAGGRREIHRRHLLAAEHLPADLHRDPPEVLPQQPGPVPDQQLSSRFRRKPALRPRLHRRRRIFEAGSVSGHPCTGDKTPSWKSTTCPPGPSAPAPS